MRKYLLLGVLLAVFLISCAEETPTIGDVQISGISNKCYRMGVGDFKGAVVVSNTGKTPFNVFTLGVDENQWTVEDFPSRTLAAGEEVRIPATFTHPGRLGTFEATLEVGVGGGGAAEVPLIIEIRDGDDSGHPDCL